MKKSIALCLFLSISVFALAQLSPAQQKLVDSLYNEVKTSKYDTTIAASLVAISEAMYVQYVDTLIPLCNKAIEICERNLKNKNLSKKEIYSFKQTLAGAYNNIGYVHGNYGDMHKQLEYFTKSLKIKETINDPKSLAISLNNVGYTYKVLGDLKKAIEYYDQSLKIKDKIGDKKGVSNSYLNIGSLYEIQGEIDKALEYYQKVLIIQEEIKDLQVKAIALNNIAYVYHQKKDFNKSFDFNFKSLALREEIQDKKGIANSFHNIGLAFKEIGELDSALKYYHLSLELKEQQQDLYALPPTLTNIGYLYQEKGNIKKAKTYALKSIEIARSTKIIHNIKEAAMLVQKIYQIEGNHKEAYQMLSLYFEMRDSLINQDNKKAALKQNMQYEYAKKAATDSIAFAKEKEIKEVEIAKQKAELKVKRNQQIGLYGGLLLVLLFAGFMYNRFKVTQKQKQIIEIQKQEVEQQKHLVEEKSKEITDSITYAKRIQEAILPSREALNEALKDGFILYKPKDIVAGDFYWMETIKGDESRVMSNENPLPNTHHSPLILFAAADCTGHGVPGAMVSVVCNNALNRSVREFGLTEPGKILDKTRDLVIQEFSKSEEEVKDGMDISLCALNTNEKILQWSGANNPLWIIRSKRHSGLDPESVNEIAGYARNDEYELLETKPDKQPIGKMENPQPFTTHSIPIQKGDVIYIFTDGFVDQFGGEKGKKYKSSQLKELLLSIQHLTMDEQRVALNSNFHNWKKDLEQVDDICIIGVRV